MEVTESMATTSSLPVFVYPAVIIPVIVILVLVVATVIGVVCVR